MQMSQRRDRVQPFTCGLPHVHDTEVEAALTCPIMSWWWLEYERLWECMWPGMACAGLLYMFCMPLASMPEPCMLEMYCCDRCT